MGARFLSKRGSGFSYVLLCFVVFSCLVCCFVCCLLSDCECAYCCTYMQSLTCTIISSFSSCSPSLNLQKWMLSGSVWSTGHHSVCLHPPRLLLSSPGRHLCITHPPQLNADQHSPLSNVVLRHDAARTNPKPFLKGHLRHRWDHSSNSPLLHLHIPLRDRYTDRHSCNHTPIPHCHLTSADFLRGSPSEFSNFFSSSKFEMVYV